MNCSRKKKEAGLLKRKKELSTKKERSKIVQGNKKKFTHEKESLKRKREKK